MTNEQWEKFVKATGYVTVAERAPTGRNSTAPPENLVAGSTVYPRAGRFPLKNMLPMVALPKRRELAASGRPPETSLKGREKYPVVQIAYTMPRVRKMGGKTSANRGRI